ncbi:hypothetical protein BKA00_002216 [Actinomadura coerulea]|uniref:TPM domain-containing protein n=1 Tax=Actinomadura coerulea TaxID=46159 RepID=A0A7X0FY83_9ACTN|nr:hypothetical protein [Actinomadura coerulea]MBB6395302.1 hypothetical protein [Actinomadura coerulea]GGQ35186.1 hypothetical protein GCM10010187_60680 [Actinomadura coerulea]
MRRLSTLPRFSAVLAVLALAVLPGAAAADEPPPHAYHRLDRVGAALAKDPLFVDPDVAQALGAPDRARLRAALTAAAKRLGTPAYVVVIPNPSQSESQGRDDAFLFMLHERSRRDGLYVMADGHGNLESEAFNVPRRGRSPWDELDEEDAPGAARPADSERPFDGLADRIVRRLDGYAAAPSASPTMPRLYSSPDPFGQETTLTPAEPEIKAPLLTGLLLAGPAAAAVLYWLGLGVLALRRGRTSRSPEPRQARVYARARTRPSMRWLRRHAAKELEALRRLLAAAGGERGRDYAVSAYDAAQILYDDAKDDESKAIDLVGAIVLARQGQIALVRDVASPPAPCLVNPLHGNSVVRKRVRKLEKEHGGALPRQCPLCVTCRDLDGRHALDERRLLRIPGPDGHRPHTLVAGVWRETAWGAHGKTFLPRVMRYLGVD